ncbi:ATP-binding protein [Streptomyces sp. NPDC005408]|uniref:ATP-binding protein n=1 Tax=Streptomyces sp. NPDC005408 TaxID=3155341 RepID=UPI0033BB73B7
MTTAALAPPAPSAHYCFIGPNLPSTPRVARDWLVALVRSTGHPQLAEAAQLCTSEVVTNVHVHTRTPQIVVEAEVSDLHVMVKVYDNRPHPLPESGEWRLSEERGRGLDLIDRYADAWGATFYGGRIPTKKAVWFQLTEHERQAA